MRKPLIILLGLLILVVALFWIYLPPLTRYRELKAEEDRLTVNLAGLEIKIRELEKERDLLKNDLQYIEKVIRDELKLVKPGEILYKFVTKKEEPKPVPEEEPIVAAISETIAEMPAPFEIKAPEPEPESEMIPVPETR